MFYYIFLKNDLIEKEMLTFAADYKVLREKQTAFDLGEITTL